MMFDTKKKYPFEGNSIDFLRGKVNYLLRVKDYLMEKKDNRQIMGFLLKKIAQQGFLRTHALLVNWLEEFFKHGVLTIKGMHEIVAQLPWSWKQTTKYIDILVNNGLISYSRDSTGKKLCRLKIEEGNGKNSNNSNQLQRLFDCLKKEKQLPDQNILQKIRELTIKYYEKITKLEQMKQRIKLTKEKIQPANEDQLEQLVEDIVSEYLQLNVKNEVNIVRTIIPIFEKEPALLFSLKYKER